MHHDGRSYMHLPGVGLIQSIRQKARFLLPIIIVVLIAGLVVSRILDTGSEQAIPEPGVVITAGEADSYIGTVAEVCGKVVSASYLPSENGRPTFLNFEQAYPNQVFTAKIFGEHRNRFSPPPEKRYANQTVCVTGRIESHQKTPQIRVSDPRQIRQQE